MTKKRYVQYTINLDARQVRTDYLEGKECFVVPTAMMTEGVHEGSKGPLLYTENDLDRWSPAWNYKPIVHNHPKKGSACTKEFLTKNKLGVVLNAHFDGKQRAESWLEKDKLKARDPKLFQAIKNKKVVEVSTGLHVDLAGGPGKFHGKAYKAVAKNHRPDHLAILTKGQGACSVKDGAGLGVMNKKRRQKLKDQLKQEILNELNHDDVDGDEPRKVKTKVSNSKGKHMATKAKRKFVSGLIKNEQTQFTEKDREWLLTLNERQLKNLEPKKLEFSFSSKEEMDAAIEKGIESGLAANLKNPKKLKKLLAQVENSSDDEEDEDKPDDEMDEESSTKKNMKKLGIKNKKAKKVDLNEFLENAPAEIRTVLNASLAESRRKHLKLAKIVFNSKNNRFTKEQLLKMDPDMLRGIASMARASTPAKNSARSFFGAAVPSGVRNKKKSEKSPMHVLKLPVFNADKADAMRDGTRLKKARAKRNKMLVG